MILPFGLGHTLKDLSLFTLVIMGFQILLYFFEPTSALSNINYPFDPKDFAKYFFINSSFLQLASNLYIVYFFGRYVESRMGGASYFLLYLLGGAISMLPAVFGWTKFELLMSTAGSIAIGIAFVVLFAKTNMTLVFSLLVFNKQSRVPVSFFGPISVFLLVLGGLINFDAKIPTDSVMASVILVAFSSLILVMIYKKMRPLNEYFLYEEEYSAWNEIKSRQSSTKEQLEIGRTLLRVNPGNLKIRHDLSMKIARDLKNEFAETEIGLKFLLRNFSPLMEKLVIRSEKILAFELLESIPVKVGFEKIFRRLTEEQLVFFSKMAVKSKNRSLAMLLLATFVDHYPKSDKMESVTKNLDVLISKELEKDNTYDIVTYIEASCKNERLKALINRHIQFGNTQVVLKNQG